MSSFDERYSRQLILPEIGKKGQEKLSKAKVLIVGMGALGVPAALYLAGLGVGELTLMDDDSIEISNLSRQIIYRTDQIGMSKVEAIALHIEKLNPEIRVNALKEKFTDLNALNLISKNDFTIDGSDNFSTKFLINDASFFEKKPFSHAGVLGFEGQTMTVVNPDSPCYRCVFIEPPENGVVPNCSEAGIMGPIAGLIGTIQALEAVKSIVGIGDLLTGSILTINAVSMSFRKIGFKKNPNCPLCGEKPTITSCVASGVPVCDFKNQISPQQTFLLTFKNNQSVMKAERFLKSKSVVVEPRVTPRQLSDECGICLQVESSEIEHLKDALATQNIEISRYGDFNTF